VGLHLGKVAIITNVVGNPVLVRIAIYLLPAAQSFDEREGLKNRTGIGLSSAKVINLTAAREQ